MDGTLSPDGISRSASPAFISDHDAACPKQIIVALLQASLEAIETNRAAAAHYIERACAVFQEAEVPSTKGGGSQAQGGLAPWQLNAVKAFIEANLEKPLDVPALATVARLGPSYFQRAFKKTVAMTPHAYLVGRRINRAQELMLLSDAPLSEIALAAGFSDQAHFTMRFRSVVGVTPGAWRRERRVAKYRDRPRRSPLGGSHAAAAPA